ncbi:MAG: hypothetical protein EOO43_25580, partial [Flavobacterium sp.]
MLELLNHDKDSIMTLDNLKKISRRIPAIDHEKKIKTFTEHTKNVKTFVWSPKFRIMASAGDERYMYFLLEEEVILIVKIEYCGIFSRVNVLDICMVIPQVFKIWQSMKNV